MREKIKDREKKKQMKVRVREKVKKRKDDTSMHSLHHLRTLLR